MNSNSVDSFKSEVFLKLFENRNLYDPLVITDIENTSQLQSDDLLKKETDGIIRLTYLRQKLELIMEIINRTAPQVVERGLAVLEKMI